MSRIPVNRTSTSVVTSVQSGCSTFHDSEFLLRGLRLSQPSILVRQSTLKRKEKEKRERREDPDSSQACRYRSDPPHKSQGWKGF